MSGSESAPTIPGANMGPEVSPEFVEKVLGSCAFKSVASTIVGGGAGFFFGAFFGLPTNLDHLRPDAPKLSTWQQVKDGFKESGRNGVRMARGFAVAGGVFVACECVIEKKRGKSDIYNSLMGGCVAGAALSARGGPQAMAFGCAGFSLFSAAMELFVSGTAK